MADDSTQKPSRSQADKEKSRQQSRPVSGKQAARTVTGGKPGAKGNGQGRPGGTRPAKSGGAKGSQGKGGQARGGASRGPKGSPKRPVSTRRSPTALLTWGVVGLVLVIVIVLVVVKVTGGSNTQNVSDTFVPSASGVVHDVTNIPTSVYNQVGVNSSIAVSPPTVIKGQPPLTFNGQPGVFYFGAEYCPYCAAQRWAMVASLSRFGKFAKLGDMQSSSTDIYPNTQTFSFRELTFSSPYVALVTREYESNQPNPAGGYKVLQPLTQAEQRLVTTYDTSKYLPSVPASQAGSNPFPFFDIGNKVMQSGASYSPSILAGSTRQQIAAGLSDPTNPVTQAIIASSNYLSAGVCHADGNQPASVCTSKGVTVASKALGLS